MDHVLQLFAPPLEAATCRLPEGARHSAARLDQNAPSGAVIDPSLDDRALEVYARACDPDDPLELRDLWLGRIEAELGPHALRPWLAERWRSSSVLRAVDPQEVLGSRATARFVKELFNWYFRNDLYGVRRADSTLILSGGAVDEERWGLPAALKECIRYALARDWYGYSDSRGRDPARQAVAAYENARLHGAAYGIENVALTMGGTFAISGLADFILSAAPVGGSPALVGIPNYPPLVEAVSRRASTRLVPLPSTSGQTSLRPLIEALTLQTPLVLLQTVANPTGAAVAEGELTGLVEAASSSTMIVLDECHEWLGGARLRSRARAASNVVRVSSLSKEWSAPGLKIGWMLADSAFVEEYYEYASTTFGGPPSFFYTLIEVLARMERWLHMGRDHLTQAECDEFESSYQLNLERLQRAYVSYRDDRLARQVDLSTLRDAVTAELHLPGVKVFPAKHSINIAVELVAFDDSYGCFLDILRATDVSIYPGILAFCFSQGVVRITTARRWDDLSTALARIAAHLRANVEGG